MNLFDDGVLSADYIRSALRETCDHRDDGSKGLTPASVLIGLFRPEGSEWQVLFTRRTNLVESHKGQVAFPGGAAETTDQNVVETALREANEEIGLPHACVDVLGCMQTMETVTGYNITPVVANLCWPFDVHPAEAEVERVFSVPLAWLANPENREERLYTRSNGSREMVVFYHSYDGEIIWGATARIMVNFLQLLEKK